MSNKSRQSYFLPYQWAWLEDKSRLKIAEKSRRIGWTWVQSYEDVRDAAVEGGCDVWFSSADITAAKEYIRYCAMWARQMNVAAKDLGEIVIDESDDIKVLSLEFKNKNRINALSSSPKSFRSKGGKVILDEFAFHQDADELWKAAAPSVTWGFPLRIISTHNGKQSKFYQMVEAAKRPGSVWSLHSTTVIEAVKAGMVDRLLKRKATKKEKNQFIADCRGIAGDDDAFQQEYMCIATDSGGAWLSWEKINAVVNKKAGIPSKFSDKAVYMGMDIGRRIDKTVIYAIEKVGDVYWTREVASLRKARFREQMQEFGRMYKRYKPIRCCIDQTGMGEKVVEDLQDLFGKYAIEGVIMSPPAKANLAATIAQMFDDRRVRIPNDQEVISSHRAVKRSMTAAGNVRYDSGSTDDDHADHFWAHALALHAAGSTAEWDPKDIGIVRKTIDADFGGVMAKTKEADFVTMGDETV